MAQLGDDLASGFGLLSRLPLPQRVFSGARSVWVWPLVGAVIGAAAGLAAWAGTATGLPAGVTAAGVMAVTALLTGAMHEDGLADSADGLFGGWTPERRLEIMKDSRIGSYGMLALMITGLARWSALTALIAAPSAMAVLIAAGALSRAPMAVMMALMPNARQGGLSAGTGRPSLPRAALACALALTLALAALGLVALPLTLAALVPALAMARLAHARIGGQTGDILGATQHLSETAILIAASALLP
ncbi:MAG: adenosylcobinamide-GDP ribazoletransferase [Rhodobacteraceae bacterium PARR1]|nr:MAG: adenosylcobinamide-GDP ribazoletransferase [Rhodobacteraceae bacterium PARR1]